MRPLAREILTFLFLVFLFSSVPYALMIHSHHIGSGGGLVVRLVMWCPTFAALATCALRRIDTSTLGWNWLPAKYEAYGYFLPLLYAMPVYAATWIAIKGSFALHSFEAAVATSFNMPEWPQFTAFVLEIPLLATLGVIGSLANALGEEIGWRGFCYHDWLVSSASLWVALRADASGRCGIIRGCCGLTITQGRILAMRSRALR